MKKTFLSTIGALLLCFSHTGIADDFFADTPFTRDDVSWRTISPKESDITVDLGKIPGEKLRAFRGEALIEARPLHIIAVMMDVDRFPEWIYQLDFVEREQHIDQPKNFYLAFKGMWPTKPRDVGVTGKASHNEETGVINMLSVGTGDNVYPLREGYVRIPRLYNLWTLTPKGENQTSVTFTTFVDIGGGVPKWLVNLVSESAPRRTINGLKQQLATGRYNISSPSELPFVPDGLPLK